MHEESKSLLARIRQFLAAPVFEGDEDKTRTAKLLNTTLLANLAIWLATSFAIPTSANLLASVLATGTMILLSLGSLYLMRLGYVRFVSGLFSFTYWVAGTGLVLLSGGIDSPMAIIYLVVLIIAALLLGRWAAIVFGGLSIAAIIGVLSLESNNLLPQVALPVIWLTKVMILISGIIIVAVLLFLATRSIDDALERARRNERNLAESNRELQAARTSLEQRVAERTAELTQRSQELEKLNLELGITTRQTERRAVQLAARGQVTRAASQIRDLDQLLPQVTHLISQAFGYYHVGIFMADEAGRYAVLRAANSEGGQRMLARGHKLAVGAQEMVGYVVSTSQPRVALDVGADAVHFDNPDLPETRSEIALPLQASGQTFGALDVQSTQAAAFTDEDVAILSMMADQVAIAIDNARLFAQTQSALQEAEKTQRRYLRQEWERLLPTLSSASHEYHMSGVPLVGDAPLPEMEQAIQTSDVVTMTSQAAARSALAVPIKLRDQVIGVIDLHETDAEREWSVDDVALVTAVAEQAALALENARLFEQTQQRARREQLITEIAAKMRAAPDVEGILRATVHEIRRALGVSHGVIRLGAKATRLKPGAPAGNGQTGEGDNRDE